MNEKFLELSHEKQLRIINAGMEVFGKCEYKHAVTDDIAAKAGISKGLLFYYFRNKQSFYMYLYEYCYELIKQFVVDDEFSEITDFFEMMEFGANHKMALLSEYPYIIEFVMRAFYSKNEPISHEIEQNMQASFNKSYQIYFKNIDWTKFKEGIDPSYVYQMLIWMTDGYLHEKTWSQKPINLDEIMQDFRKWEAMFRRMVYKEEYV